MGKAIAWLLGSRTLDKPRRSEIIGRTMKAKVVNCNVKANKHWPDKPVIKSYGGKNDQEHVLGRRIGDTRRIDESIAKQALQAVGAYSGYAKPRRKRKTI